VTGLFPDSFFIRYYFTSDISNAVKMPLLPTGKAAVCSALNKNLAYFSVPDLY
jgi:hypothetical protein